jgi:hypothetical protein
VPANHPNKREIISASIDSRSFAPLQRYDRQDARHLDEGALVRCDEVHYVGAGQNAMMAFELYTEVALARDMAELGLRRGDLVKVVDHHVAPDGEEGYSIEAFNALGETIAVTAVPVSALEALREDEVLSVRPLAREG